MTTAPDYQSFPFEAGPSAQNPTLVPQFDPFVVNDAVGGGGQFEGLDQFLSNFPRQNATGTVILTGSATVGDTVAISLVSGNLPNEGVVQLTALCVTGDTLTTLAEKLLTQCKNNLVLAALGVDCSLGLSGSDPMLTFSWPGPVGNLVIMQAWSFKSSATITIGGSPVEADTVALTLASALLPATTGIITLTGTATAGDVISFVIEHPAIAGGRTTVSYTVLGGGTLTTIAAGLVTAINASTALDALSMSASSNGALVFVSWGAAFGPVTFTGSCTDAATEILTLAGVSGSAPSSLAPTPAPSETVTLTGSATTDDVVSLTINAQGFGQPVTVSYVVDSGDTTLALVAVGLAAAINDSAVLATGSFVATAEGDVITITWSRQLGGVGFTATAFAASSTGYTMEQSPVSLTLTYTVGATPTTTTVATGVKNLVNANVICIAAGIQQSSSSAVITQTWNGAINPLTISKVVVGGVTATISAETKTNQTVTITGTATAGDTLNVRFTDRALPGGVVTVSVAITAGMTTTQMATAIKNAVNANLDLNEWGITATSSTNVVTVSTEQEDLIPVITAWGHGPAETITLTGTLTTGDIVNVKFTNALLPGGVYTFQFTVTGSETTLTLLATAIKTAMNADTTLDLLGLVATSALGVVSFTWAATAGPLAIATSTNGTRTATITGTPGTGETPAIIITDAGYASSPKTFTYTVQALDTNTLIAAGLAALIHADSETLALGIDATSATNVVTITSTSKLATTLTRTNSAGTTITLGGGPSESSAAAAGPTELAAVSGVTGGSEVLTATSPLAGGSGPVLPSKNFVFSQAADPMGNSSGAVQEFWANRPVLVDETTLAALLEAAKGDASIQFK